MKRLLQRPYPLVMLILAVVVVRFFNERPGYTDAFYHYNAAVRVASGDGFVDDYLWTYIGAPDELPAPSHLYWMPLTSMVAALGMWLFGTTYLAAQIGLILCIWGALLITYWLALRLTGRLMYAWASGLTLLMGGFLMRVWGVTDTFAIYAFVGAAALACMGLGLTETRRPWLWWLLAGLFTALGHLTRSDGLILLIVAGVALFWPGDFLQKRGTLLQRLRWLVIFLVAYGIIMLPWFLRNLDAVGHILPVGGTQAVWYTEYNDLFNYPPDANPQTFFADGLGLLVESRLQGLSSALQNLLAIEGYIVLLPFMLYGLWLKRRDPFLRPMWLFALGIHLAFAFVFTFPGIRGGMFHALVALMPFWCVLGFAGLDAFIDVIGKRYRRWNVRRAKMVYPWMLVGVIIIMGLALSLPQRLVDRQIVPDLYQALIETLPDDARVMINDPAQLYYYTGLGGVTLVNEPPETALAVADQYHVDYLVIEYRDTPEGQYISAPEPFFFDLDEPPAFFDPIELNISGARLYAINH
ncbi:glycosyltransferase family 39 protein [Phototrophicus methaneseepsis]|uniref:Glycosyltransferase family 39 protein n=1 Tax=Phototrophicus methaneseepsis TaxID=2710758 RepID=A0A7S8E5C9_9CHLR|nr:glycosyltransferase family 39 protein [Phototrophicus methaneseepsis]QPC80603.1 glycosyltransferase family 39 protein [Phototrophicus methaneseepsis]